MFIWAGWISVLFSAEMTRELNSKKTKTQIVVMNSGDTYFNQRLMRGFSKSLK